MRTWNLRTEINAPAELVWNTISDFRNLTAWNQAITESVVLTPGPVEKGSRIKTWTSHRLTQLVVQEFLPHRMLTAKVEMGSTRGLLQYVLKQENGKTLVEHTLVLIPEGDEELYYMNIGVTMQQESDCLKEWTERMYKVIRSKEVLIKQ
jgi:uncharacterized protein YndB with AHSA1/START domain